MKYIHFCFIFCFVSSLSLKAQNSEDVVKDVLRFTNPEWFQSLAQPGKKSYKPQPFDSVLIEYANKVERRKILIQTVQYVGEFKNGLFHGKGKLLLKLFSYPFQENKPGTFTYEGDFENGAATGKAFLNYSWWYTPREMKAFFVKMNCQVEFAGGSLKSGLIRYDHLLNDVPVLTSYYSGELLMKNWAPVLHGLGIVYVSKNSPGSEMAKRSPGIDGGIYAGNFIHGEYTGFGVCNYRNSFDESLSNLMVGIVGKGELLHTFSTLPVNKDWTYREILPKETNSEYFSRVFGSFKEVKRGVLYLDKENKYTGGIKDDLPHGIGYIENGNGFYDIAFWNAGKRLSVKEVLGHLLPDPSMLEVKKIKKKVAYENSNYATTKIIFDADYYGKLNSNGYPEGWGILLCTNESGTTRGNTVYDNLGTVIGNFNGYSLDNFIHENDIMSTIQNNDRNQAFKIALRTNDLFAYYTFISLARLPGYLNQSVNEYYFFDTPQIATEETQAFKDDMDDYQRAKIATMTYISGRKEIVVKAVYLSSISGSSYVETYTGEKIYLQELTADEVNYGDFILHKDVFYEVNRASMLNDYIAPNANSPHLSVTDAFNKQVGYVLKGYWMAARYESDPDNVCVYCGGKPPGKSTYTGVGYTGRYENNVYNNNSGGINIVSKPITTITTVTVDNKPCKYCSGNEAKRRAKVNVIRN